MGDNRRPLFPVRRSIILCHLIRSSPQKRKISLFRRQLMTNEISGQIFAIGINWKWKLKANYQPTYNGPFVYNFCYCLYLFRSINERKENEEPKEITIKVINKTQDDSTQPQQVLRPITIHSFRNFRYRTPH